MAGQETRAEVDRIALGYFREVLDWLAHNHAELARTSDHDLSADMPVNAIWKLSGQSLSLSHTLLSQLDHGYTLQTWPTLRAIHEADRLLAAMLDPEGLALTRKWLRDVPIGQKEARAAEERGYQRAANEMKEAGEEPLATDISMYTGKLYSAMSDAAHHRRRIVDESVDHEARTMVIGPDEDPGRRSRFVLFGGAVLHEVVMLVGTAQRIQDPELLEPVKKAAERFEQALGALEDLEEHRDLAIRLGLVQPD